MSLAKCAADLGAKLNKKDLEAIQALVDKGMADVNAVRQHLTSIDKELTGIAKKVAKQGGAVAKATPVKTQAKTLEQKADKTTRGAIEIFNEGMQRINIRLNKKADMSTFLHETGHLFLELEGRRAAEVGVSDNSQAILDWLGVKSFDDISVKQHEKWARAYEAYLREGKSPSRTLKDSFRAFGNWLRKIYANIRELDVVLDNDIRQVFDRLLASEVAIKEMQVNPAYDMYFKSQEQSGMSDTDWAKHEAQRDKARKSAQERLDRTLVDELRRYRTKEWNDEKKQIVEEEKEKFRAQPIYQAYVEAQVSAMDAREVRDVLGLAPHDKLPMKLQMASKNPKDGAAGISVEALAAAHGFEPAQMLQGFVDMPSMKAVADEAAQARMLDKYGDILNDGTIEEEAANAVHNEDQEALLMQELRAVKRKANSNRVVDRKYIKAKAQEHVAKMKRNELRPARFKRNERNAAVKASKAESQDQVLEYKIQQAVNFYLYSEATKARDKFDSNLRRLRKASNAKLKSPKVLNESVGNAAREHLRLYDFRPALPKKATPAEHARRRASAEKVLHWFESQVALAPGETLTIDAIYRAGDLHLWDANLVSALAARVNDPEAYANYEFPHYADMTVDQMQGVMDMHNHFMHVGRATSETVASERKLERVRAVESINANAPKRKARAFDETGVGKWSSTLAEIGYGMVNLKNLLRTVDNSYARDDAQGVLDNLIYDRMAESFDNEITLGMEMRDVFKRELSGLSDVGLKAHKKTRTLESGENIDISEQGVFYMSLLWGSQSGREAVMDGFGMTQADAMALMSTLKPEQLRLLDKVWGSLDHLWPELQAASFSRYGVSPVKVPSAPFIVNGVELTGGYAPLSYQDGSGDRGSIDEDMQSLHNISTSAALGKASSLFDRVGSGGRKPDLSLSLIQQTTDRNVHFIAFADSSFEINTLLKSSSVRDAIVSNHSLALYNAILGTVRSVTIGQRDATRYKFLDSALLGQLRSALTARHLAYSVKNSIEQFTSLPLAIEEVGTVDFNNAMLELVNPATSSDTVARIHELSPYMKDRATFVHREAAMNVRKLSAGKAGKAWQDFVQHGFIMQTTVDKMFAYPIWWAKYKQIMAAAEVDSQGEIDYEALEKRAAREATDAVSSTVGSGADLHLGGLYQSTNTEAVRLFTMFGSWWNMRLNRMYRETHGFNILDFRALTDAQYREDTGARVVNQDVINNRHFYSTMFVVPIAAAIMTGVLTMDFPEDEDADGQRDLLPWMAQRVGAQYFAPIPIGRDIYSEITRGYTNQSVYSGGLNATGAIFNAFASDKDADELLGPMWRAATSLVPVPGASQIEKVVQGVQTEDDRGPLEILIKGNR